MSKALSFVIIIFVCCAFFLSCADDADNQPQPASADTVYTDVAYTTVYIDQQNNITRYYQRNNQNQLVGFTRFESVNPDTFARFDFDADSVLVYARYYCLNNNGFAYKYVGYNGLGAYTDSVIYSYDNQGRLISTDTYVGNTGTGYLVTYAWDNNLLVSYNTKNLDYTAYPLPVDILFIDGMGLDNTLTGLNPGYCPAGMYIPPQGPGGHAQQLLNFSYTFDNQGNVSSFFTRSDFSTDTIKGFLERYTYIVE